MVPGRGAIGPPHPGRPSGEDAGPFGTIPGEHSFLNRPRSHPVRSGGYRPRPGHRIWSSGP